MPSLYRILKLAAIYKHYSPVKSVPYKSVILRGVASCVWDIKQIWTFFFSEMVALKRTNMHPNGHMGQKFAT